MQITKGPREVAGELLLWLHFLRKGCQRPIEIDRAASSLQSNVCSNLR